MISDLSFYGLKSPKKVALNVVLALLLCLLFSFARAGTAHADTDVPIDHKGPQNNSGTSNNHDFTPFTGVGEGLFDGNVMWYKVYVKNGQSTDITVDPTCTDRIGTPTVDYSMETLSSTEYDYSAPAYDNPAYGGTFDNGNYIIEHDTHSCTATFSFHINNTAGISSGIIGHEGYRVFGFYAQIETISTPGHRKNQEQYFKVSSSNAGENSYIGLSRPDITNQTAGGKALKYSTVYSTQTDNKTWNTEVMFAPKCFEDTSGTKTIQIYDPDNGPAPPGYQNNMHADLLESPGNPPPWNTVKTWDKNVVQGGTWGASNTTGNLDYSFYHNNMVYKLEVIGAKHPNTIQIKLPFDQFDSKASVQNLCNPTCNVTSPLSATIPVNQNTSVTINGMPNDENWVNDGNHGVYIKRFDSTDGEGSSWLNGSNPYTDTVRPPPGTTSVTYKYGIYYRIGGTVTDTGIHCHVTYTVPLPVTVTCTIDAKTLLPGQSDPQMYKVIVYATGGGTGGLYDVKVTAIPGAYVTGTNHQTVNIPNGASNWSTNPPLYFSGYLAYQGSFMVTVTDPDHNIVTPDPLCSNSAAPVVSPYFQVWQNDAAAGGGFGTNKISCPGSYPAYVSPPTAYATGSFTKTGANYKGGIIANSYTGASDKQSRSDFGAVALGLIPNTPGNLGFFTNVDTNPNPNMGVWFANPNNSSLPAGQLLSWNSPSANANHCAVDFLTNTKIGVPPTWSGTVQSAISDCQSKGGRCQYTLPNNTTISGLINIPNGVQLTLYATGNVNINTSIKYNGTFDPTQRSDIPYFALITQGNVYVTNNATELDGLYVVQPTPNNSGNGPGITGTDGIFATCDAGPCNKQLVVKGAVIAQSVQLLRAHGSSLYLNPDPDGIGNAPAEIFDFVPSMVLGAPAFLPNCPTCSTQQAYSIAPVF